MEGCFISHPDLDWYLFPAFRISTRSPRKRWSRLRDPFEIIKAQEKKRERKVEVVKRKNERMERWKIAKAEGITRKEFMNNIGSDIGSCIGFFIYALVLAIYSIFRYWFLIKLQIYRDILTRKYLTFERYSNPSSKAEDPRKQNVYESKDASHYQRFI
jgi:hypothetical protein